MDKDSFLTLLILPATSILIGCDIACRYKGIHSSISFFFCSSQRTLLTEILSYVIKFMNNKVLGILSRFEAFTSILPQSAFAWTTVLI